AARLCVVQPASPQHGLASVFHGGLSGLPPIGSPRVSHRHPGDRHTGKPGPATNFAVESTTIAAVRGLLWSASNAISKGGVFAPRHPLPIGRFSMMPAIPKLPTAL